MAIEEGGQRRIYLTPREGKFAMRINEGDTSNPFYTRSIVYSGTTQDGNAYSSRQFRFPAISNAKIIKADVKDGKFKKELSIVVDDGESQFEIQMGFDSRAATSFFNVMPNLKPNVKYRISCWESKPKPGEDKKPYTVLYFTEDGEKESVKWAFTKEEPNGLPAMNKIRVKGEYVSDNSERLDFYLNMLSTDFKERFSSDGPFGKPATLDPNVTGLDESPDESGDLPF